MQRKNNLANCKIACLYLQNCPRVSLSFHTTLLTKKITFVNSQRENTNSKGDFTLKNRLESFVLKIFGMQN